MVAQSGRGAHKGAGGGRTADSEREIEGLFGCLAAWASVDVGG